MTTSGPGDQGAVVGESDVERRQASATHRWIDGLRDACRAVVESGGDVPIDVKRAAAAFPASYREAYEPTQAVVDFGRVASVSADDGIVTAIDPGPAANPSTPRFKLYTREPVSLSAVLPVLEQMGVQVTDERPFEIRADGATPTWLYDFGLLLPEGVRLDDAVQNEFRATFAAVWRGELEADGFNRLVLLARLTGRQVTVLRAYAKYLRQTGLSFSPAYVEDTLAANPAIARQLVELFAVRFDPTLDGNRILENAGIAAEIAEALDRVPSLDQDRILRALSALVQATVRTNAYRPADDGGARPVLAFKLDPSAVPDLPQPLPAHEVWVYSPSLEGVHLRGGDVARGGIRWSDRREDFRTEVLGLMKAQMVKNAVIVPTGAKGGFVVKRRDATSCYTGFMSGLLDITDNIVAGRVEPPPGVVRHDGDDPYLVVAADKGTALFSDLANDVAAGYGFWLGDAFASGGSEGYDHKRMGITARGAWESARRHFRVLGIDADTAELSVVGIGDMSGDVFGNGLLCSPHVKLVAAFDHRHVFVDPNPDPARSFAERRRLYELPRSSWDDYDRSVLSAGGGIWPRTAKRIALSDEARACLGTAAAVLTPNELISIILRAPVDLWFNGGIGTYVKASTESNADVGDRTNDAVRIDASDVRARVVVEGGNLGITQRARIEMALAGVLVNTDAIDNSAGVDTSDHEVNVKILLDAAQAAGDITRDERNAMLHAATDEVAALVLDDNRGQNLALALARAQAAPMVDVHARYLRALEHEHRVDRKLEFLPTEKQLADRQANGLGLTTPELSVVLAYTKLAQVDELLASDLPEDAYVQPQLTEYFPASLQERFANRMPAHRLRREIIVTRLVNELVNQAGTTFEFRMAEETGASTPDITRCYLAARHILGVGPSWDEVVQLDGVVDFETQLRLFLDLRRMTERSVLWLLRHRRPPVDIGATAAAFGPGVGELAASLPQLATGPHAAAMAAAVKEREAAGVPAALAARAAAWPYLHTAFDIVEVAHARGRTPADAARVYWGLFERLDLAWLWDRVGALPKTDRWKTHARAALRDDLLGELRALTDDALRAGDVFMPPAALVDAWAAANERARERVASVVAEIRSGGVFDLATLSVALRQLRNLVLSSNPSA